MKKILFLLLFISSLSYGQSNLYWGNTNIQGNISINYDVTNPVNNALYNLNPLSVYNGVNSNGGLIVCDTVYQILLGDVDNFVSGSVINILSYSNRIELIAGPIQTQQIINDATKQIELQADSSVHFNVQKEITSHHKATTDSGLVTLGQINGGYTEYAVLLTQASTNAPIPTPLGDTATFSALVSGVTFTYNNVGEYGVFFGSGTVNVNKTSIEIGSANEGSFTGNYFNTMAFDDVSQIYINTFRNGTERDDALLNTLFRIRIYN